MKTFLFPGQGSQGKGMGGTLFDDYAELTQKADAILGYSIKELCLEDPRRELNKTQFTQPALYVVSAYCYFNRIQQDPSQKPDFVAGHSLGEFNALLAAECFDFETGLKLVKKRGELMAQARDGGMAAILNASVEDIERVKQEHGLTGLALANYNSATQIVVSGPKDEIMKAYDFFQFGEVKYIPLNTSGAFHSPLMQEAKEEFAQYLNQFEFNDAKIPVIANVTAQPYGSGQVKEHLANQITHPVRWCESMNLLMDKGDMAFAEVGHGEVLSKMVTKITQERQEQQANPTQAPPQNQAPAASPEQEQVSSWLNRTHALSAEEKVALWNKTYQVGTHAKSTFVEENDLETRTEATVLFGHRAAVYMKGFNGYFDLDELVPQ